MRTMYDAVNPANLPEGGDLYAGYIDGAYTNVGHIEARFPGKKVVTITVIGGTTDADVVDVETGDVIPDHAPAWVVQQRARGRIPTVYCSSGTLPAVRAAFAGHGVSEPPYWVANYNTGPVIPDGAVAHQYADTGGYDVSVVADYWPGIDPDPSVAPLAAAPSQELLNVNVIKHQVIVGKLDAQGNGYVDSPVPFAGVVGFVVNGMDNEDTPGQLPHTYDRIADEVTCYQIGVDTRVKVVGGQPGGAVLVWLSEAVPS